MSFDERNDSTALTGFSPKVQEIAERITSDGIKAVSFDIFDTLLFRPVMQPTEIFGLLGAKLNIPNFREKRTAAEAEARKKTNPAWEDITLDEIYDEFGSFFDYPEAETDSIMREELDIERQLLYPRRTAKFLFDTAKQAGKEIFIISDMYLPSGFLEECLRKNGYSGYSGIYVSCETRKSKASGNMYKYVAGELADKNIKPCETVHIGDNKRSDLSSAVAAGFEAVWLPKPAEKVKEFPRLRNFNNFFMAQAYNTHNSMLYGILINDFFDDPFVEFEKNSVYNGDAALLGKWLGPLMFSMTKWLIEESEADKIEQFIFVMRDGFIPRKIFMKMRPYISDREMKIDTVYMGRALRLPFSAKNKNSLFDSVINYDIRPEDTVESFAKGRLYIDNEKDMNEVVSIFFRNGYLGVDVRLGRLDGYRGALAELQPFFTANASKKLERYSKYILSVIDRSKKTAFFDRSPRGFSSSFLYDNFNIECICYSSDAYDVPSTRNVSGLKSYVSYGRNYQARMGWVWAFFLERIISDTEPGFADIKENGDGTVSVVFGKKADGDNGDGQESSGLPSPDDIIHEIQDGILDFSFRASELFGKYLKYLFIDSHGVFDQTIEPFINPCKKDADLILTLTPDDSSVTTTDKEVFKKWYDQKINRGRPKKSIPKKAPLPERLRIWGYYTAERMGVLPQASKVYHSIFRKKNNDRFSADRITEHVDGKIGHAADIANYCDVGNCILFAGEPLKGAFIYLNELAAQLPQYDFIACTSDGWRRNISSAATSVMIFSMPQEFNISKVPLGSGVSLPEYGGDLHKHSLALLKATGNNEKYSRMIVHEQERYYTAILELFRPKAVIVWNAFAFNANAVKALAEKKGIPVITMESGHLDGTYIFSEKLYGDDLITKDPAGFSNLPVDAGGLELSRRIISESARKRVTRYSQNAFDQNALPKTFIKDRKTVLLVGQFDIENYSFPHEDGTGKQYSPVFSSSEDALKYISELAKRNNWNIIYKPHPLNLKNNLQGKLPSNVCFVNSDIIDLIDLSDAVICMLSGIAYTVLIRGKPLVELCRTPLYAKGCCYEAFERSEIEAAIVAALENGRTDEQKAAFEKHIAQVTEAYFYDNQQHPEMPYGRTLSQAAELIDELARGTE